MKFLRVAMGHENDSFDDFVKARDACQEDLMFFPARNAYGLASVAGSNEKLAVLQNEFEIVKKKMDDEAKKATRLEQKIKVLTHGYQMRGGKLWSQIEATFKQMGTAATELECFQALQKQERAAASYRIDNLIEEVNKQKELERILQDRYGDLIVEDEKIQRTLQVHKTRLQVEAEMAARKRAVEEELAARKLAEEIAARNRAAEEMAARIRAEEIAAAEEMAAKKLAEELAARKAAEEQAERKAAEELAARKAAEELAARKAAEEEISASNRAAEEIVAIELMSQVEDIVQSHAVLDEADANNNALDAMNQTPIEVNLQSEHAAVYESRVDSEEPVVIPEHLTLHEKSVEVDQLLNITAMLDIDVSASGLQRTDTQNPDENLSSMDNTDALVEAAADTVEISMSMNDEQ